MYIVYKLINVFSIYNLSEYMLCIIVISILGVCGYLSNV